MKRRRNSLKRCPFCGGKAKYYEYDGDTYVSCGRCGASSVASATKPDAARCWQRRIGVGDEAKATE